MFKAIVLSLVLAFVVGLGALTSGAHAMASLGFGPKAAGTLVVHHKVEDFAKWLPVFKADKPNQEAAGLTNPRVLQSMDDPNDIVILFDLGDAAKAKAFATSDALKQTMQSAGVIGAPEIMYLTTSK